MSETTTEVVEELPSSETSSPAPVWAKWSLGSLPGLLPFLPKVPGHKESIGLLQQLSPRVIKSECILTRRFWSNPSSNLPPSQPKEAVAVAPSRVQTLGAGKTVLTPAIPVTATKPVPKQDVFSTLSMFTAALFNLSLFKSIPEIFPETFRPHLALPDGQRLVRLAVYSGLMVLVLEVSACLLGLVAGAMPPGLIFMISALVLMMVIAVMTICHDPNSQGHALLSSSVQPESERKCRRR